MNRRRWTCWMNFTLLSYNSPLWITWCTGMNVVFFYRRLWLVLISFLYFSLDLLLYLLPVLRLLSFNRRWTILAEWTLIRFLLPLWIIWCTGMVVFFLIDVFNLCLFFLLHWMSLLLSLLLYLLPVLCILSFNRMKDVCANRQFLFVTF